MSSPPIGLVVLLFADVEASFEGLTTHGNAFRDAIRALQDTARRLAPAHEGFYANFTGDGFLLSFGTPEAALRCARDLHLALNASDWHAQHPNLAVRIGIHAGPVELYNGHYDGPAVWCAHRVMDAAHGGQTLLSEAAHALLEPESFAGDDLTVTLLGAFHLRDLLAPTSLYQLSSDGLPNVTRPPRARSTQHHNLPEEERPFIGRRQELNALLRLMREHQPRLVTITAMGGMGKSRLARQTAAELREDFPDGVWLVELDALRERDEIVPAIASVLGIYAPADALYHRLIQAVQSRRILLLLDCFELLKTHADVLDGLLHDAPTLHCLVTSRQVLGLPREYEFVLPPMQTITEQEAAASGGVCDSMALFHEAAAHVAHDFAITLENRADVAELCELLEGIPLSLTLAAGWLRYLSLPELLNQVRQQRLVMLTSGSLPPRHPRHADLQHVIDGSFVRLPLESRVLLHRLALFVGGFYLEDAQQVCGEVSLFAMLTQMTRLVEHSFVQKQTQGARTHFRLLDTVREYLTSASLDTDREADLYTCRERHALHFTGIAERIGAEMQAGRWEQGRTRLLEELGNLRAAIQHCAASHQHEQVVRFGDGLLRTLFEAGMWTDFELLAQAMEQAARALNQTDAETRLLGLQGALARRRGEVGHALRYWQRRLALCQQQNDIAGSADTLFDLAELARAANRREEARPILDQALTLAHQQGQPELIAIANTMQADFAWEGRDEAATRAYANHALQTLQRVSDKDTLLYTGKTLGRLFLELRDYPMADSLLKQVVHIAYQGHRTFGLGAALLEMGKLYEAQGLGLPAARAYTVAAHIHTELASQLQQQALETMARFCEETADSDVRNWLEQARSLPWQQILPELLPYKAPYTSESTPLTLTETFPAFFSASHSPDIPERDAFFLLPAAAATPASNEKDNMT